MSETSERVAILKRILEEASSKDFTFVERAGLAAAARQVVADIREAIDEDAEGHSYMREKLLKTEFGLVAGLGFEVSNGHRPANLFDLARSQLHTLESLVEESELLR